MKKLAFLGGAAGLGFMALLSSPITQAADHLDAAASLATQPMADINDVYAWNTSDATKVNLAMTVSPFDNGMRAFGPSVQYVFHLSRYKIEVLPGDFPLTPTQVATGEESQIICTFESNTSGKCWVVDPAGKVLEYVEGDMSGTAGKVSVGGKLKVFAGRRSDPFFFNLAGFATAQRKLETLCGSGTPDACPGDLTAISNAAGCPDMATIAVTGPIAQDLSEQQNGQSTPDPQSVLPTGCLATEMDCFKGKNVMAIVVQVDKTLLVDDTKKVLSVYGSTHAAQ